MHVKSIWCAFDSYVSYVCHRKSVESRIHGRNWLAQRHRMHYRWWDADLCPYLWRANHSAGNCQWCCPLFSDHIYDRNSELPYNFSNCSGNFNLPERKCSARKFSCFDAFHFTFANRTNIKRIANDRFEEARTIDRTEVAFWETGPFNRHDLRKISNQNHLRAFAPCRLFGSIIGGAWHIWGSSDIA